MRNVLVPLRSKVLFHGGGRGRGRGEQDKLTEKSGITSDQRMGGSELWAISHPVAWSKCLISEVPPDLYYFLYFVWLTWISLFIFSIDFPTCFATVANRSALRGRAIEEMARN